MTGYLGAGNGGYLQNKTPYMSGNGMASSGGGNFLGTLSGLGSAISPFAPLIGLGTTIIGGLLGNDTEEEKLAEQKRQFDLGLAQQKAEFTRNSAFKGLGELANQRQEVLQRQKNAAFRSALYQAGTMGGKK
jgi:hypothetical protein